MPKHISVEKRHRQSLVRNRRNRIVKSRVRTALKNFESASEPEARQTALRHAISATDKAVSKRVMHKNKARRLRSQLMRKANKATAETS